MLRWPFSISMSLSRTHPGSGSDFTRNVGIVVQNDFLFPATYFISSRSNKKQQPWRPLPPPLAPQPLRLYKGLSAVLAF